MEPISSKDRNIIGISVIALGFFVLDLTLLPELGTGMWSFLGGIAIMGLGFALLYVLPIKRAKNSETVYRNVFNEEKPVVSVPQELNAFYSAESSEGRIKKDLTFKTERKIEVGAHIRLIAWMMDFLLCLAVFGIIHVLMFVSTNLSIDAFANILKVNVELPVLSFIFLYNLSFLMRGAGRSFGQSMLSIETTSKERKKGLVGYLIKKANFELVSTILFGIPYLLDVDKKLFGDKVVKS